MKISCLFFLSTARIEKNLGEDVTDEYKHIIVTLHNKLIEQMESVAAMFNSTVCIKSKEEELKVSKSIRF